MAVSETPPTWNFRRRAQCRAAECPLLRPAARIVSDRQRCQRRVLSGPTERHEPADISRHGGDISRHMQGKNFRRLTRWSRATRRPRIAGTPRTGSPPARAQSKYGRSSGRISSSVNNTSPPTPIGSVESTMIASNDAFDARFTKSIPSPTITSARGSVHASPAIAGRDILSSRTNDLAVDFHHHRDGGTVLCCSTLPQHAAVAGADDPAHSAAPCASSGTCVIIS